MSFFPFLKSKKSNNKKNIFIHIPKAGGSTFVGLLKESLKDNSKIATHKIEQVGNTEIKHVNFDTEYRFFKSPEIFNSSKIDYYKSNYNIFMLFRNPVDRILSEFNFQYHILKGKEGNKNAAIITKLKPLPKNIEAYIKFKQTQNYQTKFLLGRKLTDVKPIKESEFNILINIIKTLPIHCGITDQYASFLNMFQKETTIKLNKKVVVRKKTPFIYHTDITEKIKSKIIQLNQFDYRLYEFIKENCNITNSKFQFKENDQFIV